MSHRYANIECLDEPPIVGMTYYVPWVMGRPFNLGHHKIPAQRWPVIRPAHEDSKYLPKFRTTWVDEGGEWVQKDETYYEKDDQDFHIHVDPRFAAEELYTPYEREHQDWHGILTIESEIQWDWFMCLREMPVQRLFTGFGPRFVDDHKGKKLKCKRCPHKGVDLSTIPVVDGVITCPAHGLRYDAESHVCISEFPQNTGGSA